MDKWTGVILAGGLGSRLHPLTSKIPKPLVKVANKSMLDYAIDHLKYAGIKKIIVVVKHFGEKIKEHIKNEWQDNLYQSSDLEIHVPNVDSKDTADALRKVENLIETDNIIVSMGDIVTNLPLNNLLNWHVDKKGIATISMKTIDQPRQYGVVLLDADKKIYLFLEKPDSRELYLSSLTQRSDLYLHTNLINTGIYAFKREILDILRADSNLMDFGKNVFPYLLENRYSMYGFVEKYYWMDVGLPKTYLWANWDLLRHYGWPVTPRGEEHNGFWYDEFPQHGEGCTFSKPSAFGNHVSIGKNNQLKNLNVISDNVQMGDENVIEKSVIWENSRIGSNCIIFESVICDNVTIKDNVKLVGCVVGPDCILEENQALEYEKKTANFEM